MALEVFSVCEMNELWEFWYKSAESKKRELDIQGKNHSATQ